MGDDIAQKEDHLASRWPETAKEGDFWRLYGSEQKKLLANGAPLESMDQKGDCSEWESGLS